VIDGAANTVITTIAVGDVPRALALNPVQNRTYVANYMSASISVIGDSLTGVEELGENASLFTLDVYPNLVKASFVIRTSKPLRDIKVYDILGNLVRTDIMAEPGNAAEVSVKELSAGVYFVKVSAEGIEAIKKVVVTK